jgi:hypothetical protein
MSDDAVVFVVADDSAAGHIKQALRGPVRPRVIILHSDPLLDGRLGPLADLDAVLMDRAEREARLFAGDPEIERDVAGFFDRYKSALRDFETALSDCSELHLAVGRTARDFMALAFTLALIEHAQVSRPRILRLTATAAHWPSIAEQLPNPALADRGAWVPVDQAAMDDASAFWIACTDPAPHLINRLIESRHAADSEIASAAAALVDRFPSGSTGLTALDGLILGALSDGQRELSYLLTAAWKPHGNPDPGTVSGRLMRIRHLCGGATPLLSADGPVSYLGGRTMVGITRIGLDVLSRKANALDALQHDYWVGGMHVDTSHASVWTHSEASPSTVVSRA